MTSTPVSPSLPRNPPPVLVLGATGRTGSLVAAGLRARGVPVRAASRSGEVRFDWDDPTTWDAALEGAAALYLVTPQQPDFDARKVADLVARATAAGVRHLVSLSGLSASYGSAPMLSREEPVRASGAAWTILRPGSFQQNFSSGAYHAAVLRGEMRMPLGPGPYSAFIHVGDIADVAVEVLAAAVASASGGEHAGRIYPLAGPQALSFADALSLIGREIGRDVRFVDVPLDEWTEQARAAGTGEAALRWSLDTFEGLRRGDYAPLFDGVQQVLGREPRDFASYVRSAAAEGVWG